MTEEKAYKSKPAYRIQTSRLVIRCWEPCDAPMLKSAIDASREHLRPWMPWANNEPDPVETVIERLRTWRAHFDLDQDYVYGIFNKDESAVLGSSGLHTRLGEGALEIGYWIHVDHIRLGYATELSAALTKVAFSVNRVNRVEIHCDPENKPSAAIPKKLGYSFEATLRQRIKQDEQTWRDSMIWTLLAEDYPQSLSAHADITAFDVSGRKIIYSDFPNI